MWFFLGFGWFSVMIWQSILGYGTAYRFTKKGGDNGIALFGWVVVFSIAAIVPGLGFYIWHKYRNIDVPPETPLNIKK